MIMAKNNVLKELKKNFFTFIIAAFGFVAALMWKDAISAWLEPLYATSEGAVGLTIAAILITIVATVAIYIMSRIKK